MTAILPSLPGTWRWTNLHFLMAPDESFCYGVVQPGHDDPNGIPLIRAGDLKNGTVMPNGLRRIPADVDVAHKRSRVLGGELLVTVVGAGIGESSIVPVGMKGYNIARAVAKIPIREVSAQYVHNWLRSSSAIAFMKSDSREVARPTLNLEELKTLPVPLPPLDEQFEIVRRVDALFKAIEHVESRYRSAAASALRLGPLLLAKAFRGELLAQNPDDEPASALLARITSQRDALTRAAASAHTPRRSRPPRARKETVTMTKSRQDDDVMGQPYLAEHLRRIGPAASAEVLFKVAELPVADFFKQLAWEVAQGHVKDNQTTLEPGHAAG